MTDRDFSIGGRQFKLSKLDAFKQFHIVRRVGPILAEVVSGKKVTDFSNLSEEEKLKSLSEIITPIMNGLSKLSDADADMVLYGLLGAVEVQQSSGNWAKVASNNMLMIQDLELPVLLQIAGKAFMYNVGNFTSAPLVK